MSRPRIEGVKAIFIAAKAVPPGPQRDQLLDEHCGKDPGLRLEVESLLAAKESAPGSRTPMSADDRPTSTIFSPLVEGPGTRIGPYKLLQQIGEGGFGVVFMADQEWPMRRRVALKIIKLGMDTRHVVARFEAERQALAMMDHPHIARVLDAGATESGRPYFVMELVRGVPITKYCDQHRLSIRERLELLEQVCDAVQHAHSKGLIHRDLKPSNILISVTDGDRPLPKVIDFGIAKATTASLTSQTLFTEHGAFVGTPEYMSPEQAQGALDVDTRADIYSLGVVLYELLTGSTPFARAELRQAAFGEFQRILCEVEPAPPSSRLSKSGEQLPSIAASRHCDPRKLGLIVRGDLDWIVMKALEKDPRRRYGTTHELRADVRRYLDGQAVHAAPPSAAYRLQKIFRRHKGKIIASGTVAATILALSVVATTQWVQKALAIRNLKAALAAQQTLTQEAQEARASESRARAAEAEAKDKAESALARALDEGYVSSIMSADAALLRGQPGRLRSCLNNPAQDLRGWEWRYLHAQSDSSILSYQAHRVAIHALAVSPDGSRLVTAAGDYTARVFDAETGNQILSFEGHTAPVRMVSIDPAGDRAVSTGRDAALIWDLLTGDRLGALPVADGARIEVARFTPNGCCIAAGLLDGSVQLYDAQSFERKGTYSAHTAAITDLAVSADGKLMVTASIDGTLRTWHLPEGTPGPAFARHRNVILNVALAPDGATAVSTAEKEVARLWDVRTGRQKYTIDDANAWITQAMFSPDGTQIAAFAGSNILLVDSAQGALRGTLRGHLASVRTGTFAPSGQRIYSAGSDGRVLAWDGRPPADTQSFVASYPPDCANLWNSDGERIVFCPARRAGEVWDLRTGRRLLLIGDKSERAKYAHFTPDGARIVTHADDGSGAIWEAESGRLVAKLKPLIEMIGLDAATEENAAIDYSVDGQRLIVQGYHAAEIWDRSTGRLIDTLPTGGSVTYAAFSPDGAFVLTASENYSVMLWSASTLKQLRSLSAHGASVSTAQFSSDGLRVATLDREHIIRVLQTTDGSLVDTIDVNPSSERAHSEHPQMESTTTGSPTSFILSPDGSHLLVPLSSGEWLVRDVSTRRTSCTIQAPGGLMGVAAFSPDNARVVAGTNEGVVLLFDALTGRELMTLRGLDCAVMSCGFSPDGSRVLASAASGALRVWDSVPARSRCLDRDGADTSEQFVRAWVEALRAQHDDAAARDAIARDRSLASDHRRAAYALLTDSIATRDAADIKLANAVLAPDAADARAAEWVAQARKHADQNSSDWLAAHTLGRALYNAGDLAGAVESFRHSERLAGANNTDDPDGPVNPGNWAYITMAQVRLRQLQEARAALKTLRELVVTGDHVAHPMCQRLLRDAMVAVEQAEAAPTTEDQADHLAEQD